MLEMQPKNEQLATGDSSFYDETQAFFSDEGRRGEVMNSLGLRTGYERAPMTQSEDESVYRTLLRTGVESNNKIREVLEWFFQDMPSPTTDVMRKFSPGIAHRFPPYVLVLQELLSARKRERNAEYTGSRGPGPAISAVRRLEGHLIGDPGAYNNGDVFFVNGGSNGIHSTMAFIREELPPERKTVISCGPVYNQFLRNSKRGKIPFVTLVNEEVNSDSTGKVRFLPGPDKIREAITQHGNVGALVITQPNGATGEFYSPQELNEILKIAAEHDLLVIDDSVHEELVFPEHRDPNTENNFTTVAEIAAVSQELKRVITIKSYSKGKNFPGSRIGMIITKNEPFRQYLQGKLAASRDFEAGMFKDMICLDAVMRMIEHKYRLSNDPDSLGRIVEEVFQEFKKLGTLEHIDVPINTDTALSYIRQREGDMQTYLEGYNLLERDELFHAIADTRAGFNTLLKVPSLPNHSMRQMAEGLYNEEGVETEWGPNFGIKTESGLWIRGTFSFSVDYLRDTLRRIKGFWGRHAR